MPEKPARALKNVSFYCPVGTDLVLRLEGVDARLKSTLIGVDHGEFLIVRTPRAAGIEPLLIKGSPVKVIFLHDGTIYGFLSKFLHQVRVPSPLIFISYPKDMERHEIRKNLRIDCYIPATLLIGDQMERQGVISDLSIGGCRVTLNNEGTSLSAQLKPESVLMMAIEMLGIQSDRSIRSIVKNVHQDANKIHIGVKFDTSDADVLSSIQEYVERVLGIIR